MARRKQTEVDAERQERRELAESSLEEFIKLVHPLRCLGDIHREVIRWWTRQDAKSHQLLLLPRDHMKSALIAYRVAWELTKDPTLRVLYISSTSNLATKQLKFIKDIFTNETYRLFWPLMVEKEEAKREKWTEREIALDHPKRKEESIRDPSIFTAGLTTNIVGLHCDIAALDDVVVRNNAYTAEGRDKVEDQYGHLSSIESTNAREWVVGTRYHPSDLYNKLSSIEIPEIDENGKVRKATPLFEVKQAQVESLGDGTGQFLWPRQQRSDGKWFGFDRDTLALKKAQYLNQLHFRAQYYNDPHDVGSSAIGRDQFQYYDPIWLSRRDGKWFFKQERLNVVASVDFAYSTGRTADYTSIVVIGLDGKGNYFVLDIDRFKTTKISEYYTHILNLYQKWGFRKIRAEVSVAQKVIVDDLKENYIKVNGISLAVEEYRPSRWQGSKEERIMATLEPKYSNQQIWHYVGGNCQVLEEELMFANPAHDDVKDALASAVDFAQGMAPINFTRMSMQAIQPYTFHSKFGGVA
jgi:phage terminase large subunit-like protein